MFLYITENISSACYSGQALFFRLKAFQDNSVLWEIHNNIPISLKVQYNNIVQVVNLLYFDGPNVSYLAFFFYSVLSKMDIYNILTIPIVTSDGLII